MADKPVDKFKRTGLQDEDGVKGRCVAGAINNYTSQLLTYGRSSSPECNVHAPVLQDPEQFQSLNSDSDTDELFFQRKSYNSVTVIKRFSLLQII